jgi:lipid A disaccharide synthetase
MKESFGWANFRRQFVKEDKDAYYDKVEALFPVESMSYKRVESILFFVERPLCSFIRCNLSCSGSDRDEKQIGHLKVSKIIFTNPD